MIVSEVLGGSDMVSRRALQQGETEMCSPPKVDGETIYDIISAAQQKCIEDGIAVSDEEVKSTSLAITELLEAENCWKVLCGEIVEPALEVMNTFITVAKCAGVGLDPRSCVVSATAEMIVSEKYDIQDTMCEPPKVDNSRVHYFASSAHQMCLESGESVGQQEGEETAAAFIELFGADDCWMALCMEDPGKRTSDLMAGLLLDFVADCADANINRESCLESSLLQMVLSTKSPETMNVHRPLSQQYNEYYPAGNIGELGHHLSESNREADVSDSYSEFGNEHTHFHGTYEEGENCGPLIIDEFAIHQMVVTAKNRCMTQGISIGENEVEEASEKFSKLMSAEHCWGSLCDARTGLIVVGQHMEQCARIEMPFSMLHPNEAAEKPALYERDLKVACMLNYVMTASHSEFGLADPLENSAEMCYPPAHYDIENVCPAVIGPKALDHCTLDLPVFPEKPMSYDYEDPMSYGYDFSMSHNYEWPEIDWGFSLVSDPFSMDYSWRDSKQIQEDKSAINELCQILFQMSSEKGKECLQPLCDISINEKNNYNNGGNSNNEGGDVVDDSPTSAPYALETHEPTTPLSPTKLPVATPSSMPSLTQLPVATPSSMPSKVPSSVPSTAPSVDAMATSSVTPSQIPSSSPSISTSSIALLTLSPTPTPVPSTQFPTARLENGVVEMKFQAGITVKGISVNDIPLGGEELDNLVKVLKNSISHFLPEGAQVRILKIGGISVTRRRHLRVLEESEDKEEDEEGSKDVEIEFEVTMKQECSDAECTNSDSMSENLYQGMTKDLGEAVSDGSVTTKLREDAAEEGVVALKNVEVEENSFAAEEPTIMVMTIQKNDDGGVVDDDDNSAATRHSRARGLIGAAFLAATIFPMVV